MAQVLLQVGDFILAVNQTTDAGIHRVRFEDLACGLCGSDGAQIRASTPFTADVGSEMEALDAVKYWLMLDGEHDAEARAWLIEKFGEKGMEGYMP